jgi:large subunit ribosomal protein L21e
MPFPRYKGKFGKIIGKRGKSYIVEIIDGNKTKKIISRPEHLKAM